MTTKQLLEKLVSIPSVFPHEKAISQYLVGYLQDIGFSVQTVQTGKDRNNIIASFGKTKKYIGFYGHMDTVPRDEKKGVNPYKIKMVGEKAYALGAEDMKGGISAILQMGAYAVQNNLPVKLIFAVDEEDISRGAHDLVSSGLLSDVSFLISAESGQIQNMKQPYNVCFGRKGRILFEMRVTGKKAHAAEAHKAINAIEKAAEMITALSTISFTSHKNLGKTTVVVHSIESKTDSFSVPDSATILFSLLTSPFEKSTTFMTKVKEIAAKKNIKISIQPFKRETPYGESYEVNLKDTFLNKLQTLFTRDKVKPMYTGSVADENIFANRLHIPVISIGPIGGRGHTEDEWLDMHSLAIVEELYKEIVTVYNQQ